jgi:hypothetical protein
MMSPLQLSNPQASVKYDSDDQAAHISFPGLDHLKREGDRYRWLPANYEAAPERQP